MADEQGSIEFTDAAHVETIMNQAKKGFEGDHSVPTMNALRGFASAIATLAAEIEQLKRANK